MMKNIRIIILTLLTFLAVGASAKVTFQLIPRQNVISGQNFQVTFRLTVEDENLDNLSTPKAPELDNCKLLSGPNRTTSQSYVQIINGRQSSTALIDLTCVYRAGNPGKVTIPSVSINIGGKTYTSSTGSFEILPPDASGGSSQGGQGYSGAQSQGANLSDYFVRVIFSKPSVYEQEGVIATTKLYRPANNRSQIGLEAVPKMPVYEGFLSEDLETAREGQIENYNGKNYYTFELSRVLLFPQKAGTLKVTSGTYTLKIQEQVGIIRMHGFATAQLEDYVYTTPLATGTITVKPLPEPRPAGFCGAVGSYTLSADLKPDILRTNESATYSLTFKGTGNVKYLTIPTVDFPATFDKYSAKTDVHTVVSGQTYSGSYTVDFPLVPQEVGHFEIPGFTFSYFNLSTQKYEELEVPAFPVDVKKGAAVAVAAEQKEVDASMHDILHIHALTPDYDAAAMPVFGMWWYWLIWAVALLFVIIALIVYRRQVRLSADVVGRRKTRANKVVSKRFRMAVSLMKSHQDDKFYEELGRALKGYLGDKLGIAPSGLISDTISEKLTEYGASQSTVDSVLQVLDDCEMARFTPDKSDAAMHELYDKAVAAIKSIEDIKTK